MTRRRTAKSKSRAQKPAAPESSSGERLQKVLAAAGIGSRRDCEALIADGRVEVDRRTVTELGTRVDPLHHEIRVDGVALPKPRRVYYMLNKPAGVVCTNDDPGGRVRAIDLIRSDERLFTVGRLDRSSEGLILITNDGALANQLTHPRYGVEKRYLVRIVGSPNPAIFTKLQQGIHLAEGIAKVSDINVRKRTSRFTDVEIVLQEGRNREIRRILARVGHKVVRLKRIAIGPVRLGELPVGVSRALTRDEVRKLRESAVNKRRRKKVSGRPATSSPPQRGEASRPLAPAPRGLAGKTPGKGKTPGQKERPRRGPRRPGPQRPEPQRRSGDELDELPIDALADDGADEVEVTEVPEGLPAGLVIGDDSEWNAPPPQKPQRKKPSRRRRRTR